MPGTSPSTDWTYQRLLAARQDLIAETAAGDRAVIWPGANGIGYHLDPYRTKAEEYGPWLASIAKGVGAFGLLLYFLSPLGKPWTPPGYARPKFALSSHGLGNFDYYHRRTHYRPPPPVGATTLANGRGPPVEHVLV